MVQGCFQVTLDRKVRRSKLVIIERDPTAKRNRYLLESYIRTLEKGLLPYYRPGQIYQQDNAPIHNARRTTNWLECHGIQTIKWPPYLPNLNPIKHLQWALKKMVYKLYPELATIGKSKEDLKALRRALKEAWRKLPNSLLRRLIESMP